MIKSWLDRLEKRVTALIETEYTPALFSLEQCLVMLSKGFEAVVRIRLKLYRAGILGQKQLNCFVISIGNITVGGTGKTPMAGYLAGLLLDMGLKPVVVSRGYKGKITRGAAVVGDGKGVFLDADTAGDEPWMLARTAGVPVVVGRDRYMAGQLAMERFTPDVIILDDGFQHLGLKRDLDLVLFDHEAPLGNGRMLPAGRLREPPGPAGKRIGAVVLTRSPEPGKAGLTGLPLPLAAHFPDPPFFFTRHEPFLSALFPGHPDGRTPDAGALRFQKALLFSGIAKNSAFKETVVQMGVKVVDHLEFQDHYRYKRADFLTIRHRAQALGADMILTTEKDWVKVDPGFDWESPLGVIGIRVRLDDPGAFKAFIESEFS